jgi:predicted MFS family arabinose efflux permease
LVEVAQLPGHDAPSGHIALAASLQAFIIYAIGNWLPSFFCAATNRNRPARNLMALATGFGGGIGSFFGGWLADRLGARDYRWYLWARPLTILTVPILLILLTTDSLYFALLLFAPFNFLTAAYLGR